MFKTIYWKGFSTENICLLFHHCNCRKLLWRIWKAAEYFNIRKTLQSPDNIFWLNWGIFPFWPTEKKIGKKRKNSIINFSSRNSAENFVFSTYSLLLSPQAAQLKLSGSFLQVENQAELLPSANKSLSLHMFRWLSGLAPFDFFFTPSCGVNGLRIFFIQMQ